MSGLKYRDQFWGDKHHGYHTLYERFKAGDEAVYELEMLIKEHSAMQEDQLRALAKTLGKVTNFASSGTSQMVEAWSLTKSTLELLQEIQMASFKSLQEQSRELARYRAELAHSKKRVKEGECVEAVSLMQTTTTCLQKAKETYMARCAELDKLRADQTASAKEINKAEQKLGRARDEYRAYTDKYEMVRADFEERMEKSADAFEAHDLSHLSTLKAAFVAFATAQQEQSEAMANVQTQFRESLATISVQALMDRFCSECSTGGERPPHMPFESLEGGGGAASSSAAAVQQPQPYILLSPSAAANAAAAAAAAGDNQSVGSSGKVGGGAAPAQIVDLLSDDPLPVQLQPLQQQQPVQLQPPVREEDVVLEEIDREETGRKEEDERREERKEGENEEKKESEEKKVLKREEWVEDWNLTSPRSKGEITGWEALREEAAEGRERFEKAKGLRGKKEEDERREDLKEGEKREGENEEKKVLKREEWVEDWNLTSPRSKGEVSGMEALREVLNEEKSAGGKERFEKAKGVRGRKDEKETPLSSSMSASFSASLGGSRQKLAMWLPGKRKKTSSVCSTDVAAVEGGTEGVASSSGGGGFLNKFGRSRRSNKSKTDLPGAVAGEGGVGFDDAHSTASSSRSEDKPSCLLTHSLEPTQPTVDEEGFTIRGKEDDDAGADEAKWASCSSDEDDEDASNSLQQSRIRTLTIRPETAAKPNASVDELRDAIGSISLTRSSTFDKDPWSAMGGCSSMGRGGGGGVGGASPSFSQSLGPGAFSPLRAATTGGYEHRAQFSEADFSRSNVPLSFSASLSFGGSMARARPRGSISQQGGGGGGMDSTGQMITPSLTGDGRLQRHTESGSVFGSTQQQQQDCWGSQQMLAAEGGGERGFSGSTMNLMQATIAEQRVPIAAALNEYLHVWMKGTGVEDRTTRVFGTVLVSFAASSLPLLTDSATDIEPLQLSLLEQRDEPGGAVATPIKQIVPNAKIVSVLPAKEGDAAAAAAAAADPLHLQHDFTFDRAALAAWLQQQREERPQLAFFNLEVLRYELSLGTSITAEPPLLFTSYWKVTMLKEGEDDGGAFSQSNPTGRSHVDIRVDYRLNEACALLRGGASLTSIHFETKIGAPAAVANAVTEPAAEWDALTATLNWRLGELSLAGEAASGASAASASGAAASSGSLKARVYLTEGSGAPPPAPTSVQFTAPSVSLSSSSLALSPSSDTYHMSMLRRKVMAGKYFCEPQLRI